MATITIKIKGLEAAHQVLGAKAGLLGSTAKGGVTFAQLGKTGLLAGQREIETEGGRFALAKSGAAAHHTGGVAKGLPHGLSMAPHPGPIAPSSGGLKVGAAKGTFSSLGFFGPILILASLGLVATGIYIYLRKRQATTPRDA
jgi:hypothetical protein